MSDHPHCILYTETGTSGKGRSGREGPLLELRPELHELRAQGGELRPELVHRSLERRDPLILRRRARRGRAPRPWRLGRVGGHRLTAQEMRVADLLLASPAREPGDECL